MGIARRGHEALGLVHYDVDFLLSLEALSVEAYVVIVDVDLGAEFGDHLAVHGDHSGLYQGVGFAAGAYARIGYEFVEAHYILYGSLVLLRVLASVHYWTALDHAADALERILAEHSGAGLRRLLPPGCGGPSGGASLLPAGSVPVSSAVLTVSSLAALAVLAGSALSVGVLFIAVLAGPAVGISSALAAAVAVSSAVLSVSFLAAFTVLAGPAVAVG